jgi:hypothetical protein
MTHMVIRQVPKSILVSWRAMPMSIRRRIFPASKPLSIRALAFRYCRLRGRRLHLTLYRLRLAWLVLTQEVLIRGVRLW